MSSSTTRHPSEREIALVASRDTGIWERLRVGWHARQCRSCARRLATYREDRSRIQIALDSGLPPGLDWNRLSGEMTANIRVGLAAGECVAPQKSDRIRLSYRPAMGLAGLFVVLLAAAWMKPWSNLPWMSSGKPVSLSEFSGSGPVLEASASGIELKQNGSALALTQGAERPVAVSVSTQGAARARYVDDGQITITSVYVQ